MKYQRIQRKLKNLRKHKMSNRSRIEKLEKRILPTVIIVNNTDGAKALFSSDGVVCDMSKIIIEKGKY